MARILIIDDDNLVSDLLTAAFVALGHNVTWADSGEAGLKACAAVRPDLIVLDSIMPGLSGPQVLVKLQRNIETRDIPVLMLTAIATNDDVVTALNIGAADYITKPFEPAELTARVDSILRRKNMPYLKSCAG